MANQKDAWSEAFGAAYAASTSGMASAVRPERLFHFTDCAGLIGILENKTLCASLSASLNDISEIGYGLNRVRSLIEKRDADAAGAFLDSVARSLDPEDWIPLPFLAFQIRIFIVSLCASAERSVHWLHYGRSGTGFALGFDPQAIERNGFALVPVVYEESKQDDLFRQILQAGWKWLQDQRAPNRDFLATIATAAAIWTALPAVKDPAFSNEEEWRLVAHDLGFAGQLSSQVRFRSCGGRVVPYRELVFDTLPLREIILGASVPMTPEDAAMSLLINHTLSERRVAIKRSTVPVRA